MDNTGKTITQKGLNMESISYSPLSTAANTCQEVAPPYNKGVWEAI